MSTPLSKPRPDFRAVAKRRRDNRSIEQITTHYELERNLTDQLMNAPAAKRSEVYGEVYSRLFASLHDHPQNTRTAEMDAQRARYQLSYIAPYLRPDSVFMEVGCGDARIAKAISRRAARAYGLDVTDALIAPDPTMTDFRFLKTDGVSVPLPDDTLDLTYSNQLMEHLHPSDAVAQLREIWRTLKPGGRYICITPNRATGPHDVSSYFDYESTCLHLKEYDFAQLRHVMRSAGFGSTQFKIASRGVQLPMPFWAGRMLERTLLALPLQLRATLSRNPFVTAAMGIYVVATK